MFFDFDDSGYHLLQQSLAATRGYLLQRTLVVMHPQREA